jgi:hypothetical protein
MHHCTQEETFPWQKYNKQIKKKTQSQKKNDKKAIFATYIIPIVSIINKVTYLLMGPVERE